MGSFSLVVATLACVRCGREREEVQVQFKTGDDHAMPWYQDGEHVPDVPPDTYDGIADAYCGRCMNQWSADEKQAVFEVLADGVARGELVIKRGDIVRDRQYVPIPDGRGDFQVQLEGDRALTPAEIAATGREAQQQGYRSAFPMSVADVDYVIFEGDERVYPSRLSSDWPPRLMAAVDRVLRARGWPLGGDPWIEPAVVVGNDQILRVIRW
jgi:hypothetical protein